MNREQEKELIKTIQVIFTALPIKVIDVIVTEIINAVAEIDGEISSTQNQFN